MASGEWNVSRKPLQVLWPAMPWITRRIDNTIIEQSRGVIPGREAERPSEPGISRRARRDTGGEIPGSLAAH
ncbi:MAG TPA: hypothetical protein VGC77_03530, partial [Rhodopseudomonas sp.]|uniref:hypothetical protein n=1 Tax=Rhodopseudomonas sp. TaxID=1078 RepID=UPI002ED94572